MRQQRGIKTAVFALLIGTFFQVKGETSVVVKLSTQRLLRTTSERFLSVTLGVSAHRYGWRTLKTIPKMVSLARELTPAHLRVGGTTQDFLHWNESGKDLNCFNATQLKRLHTFARSAELDVIFGVPALPRKGDGSWDPTNALELFKYVEEKGYEMNWELGNEPDRWHFLNISITAEQLAHDFRYMKVLLKKYRGKNLLYGPDVSSIHSDHDYLKRFLDSLGSGIVDAVTYHQYYRNSEGAKLQDFINVEILDDLIHYSKEAVELIYSAQGEDTIIWLGETSSMYNSGAKGLSDTYVAGFMWLDKLGITALVNHSVVCRQTFVGGYYGLLDPESLDPLPDYWTSVLHKRLIGEKVLMVDDSLKQGRKARIYAHCTKITKHYAYEAGAITLIVLNLYPTEVLSFELEEELKNLDVDQFLLLPGTTEITSKTVKLNGNLLKLGTHYQLPELNAVQVKQPVSVPPLTYGFFVVPQAKAKACLTKDVPDLNKTF